MNAKNNTSCIVLQLQPHTHSQHCFKPCYYFIIRTCFASLQTVDPTYPALVPFRDFDPGTDAARIETAIKTKGKGSWLGGYAFSSGTFGFSKPWIVAILVIVYLHSCVTVITRKNHY